MFTDFFLAPSDAEAVASIRTPAGPSEAGLETREMKGIDPIVNLATLEEILTGTDAMDIIGASAQPIAGGGDEGPFVYRVRPSLTGALAGMDSSRFPEVAARWAATEELQGSAPADLVPVLRDLRWLAEKTAEYQQTLYCFWSL